MEALPLNQTQREQLKEMVRYLFPEYTHISIGGEYVSLSKTPLSNLDITWNRIHWLELLMREGLRRIYVLGKYDDKWMFNKIRHISISLMTPQAKHPVTLFYEEFLKVLPNSGNNGHRQTA